jgi:hypothetical protein
MISSIGDRLTAGEYRVHSRFSSAINFLCGQRFAAVVDEKTGAGPLNIVIGEIDLANIRSLRIGEDCLWLDNREICYSRCLRYSSLISLRKGFDPEKFLSNLSVLEGVLQSYSSPRSLAFLISPFRKKYLATPSELEFAKRIEQGVHTFFHGEWLDGIKMIRGLGFGLTPSGDDFIAGMLIAMNLSSLISNRESAWLIEKCYDAAIGENLLSNMFLYCARRGWLSAKQKKSVDALLYHDSIAVEESARSLLAIGDTSGADWATGFLMTARESLLRA